MHHPLPHPLVLTLSRPILPSATTLTLKPTRTCPSPFPLSLPANPSRPTTLPFPIGPALLGRNTTTVEETQALFRTIPGNSQIIPICQDTVDINGIVDGHVVCGE
jgi:hypothetical protein